MISDSRPGHSFTDQLGRPIIIAYPPRRIVSLVPSQTELLFDLGVGDAVAGITKFCVHPPEWRKTKTIIGGTKKLDLDKIETLQPDLIIGNKEENYKEGIDVLSSRYPVWMSDIYNLTDALAMITAVGELVDKKEKAQLLSDQIQQNFARLTRIDGRRVLYFIWRKPWMVAASNTFIDDMLARCGLVNAAENHQRYPELNEELIRSLNPDVILLSSEPYPFDDRHRNELKKICPQAAIRLVDGEMFSWYGSRLLRSVDYLNTFTESITRA